MQPSASIPFSNLAQYHADFAFLGAGGITPDAYLTDYSRMAAEVRSRMIGAANVAVVVADPIQNSDASRRCGSTASRACDTS